MKERFGVTIVVLRRVIVKYLVYVFFGRCSAHARRVLVVFFQRWFLLLDAK